MTRLPIRSVRRLAIWKGGIGRDEGGETGEVSDGYPYISPSVSSADASVGDIIGSVIIPRPPFFTAIPLTEDAAVGDLAGTIRT
jgi:hypothetical protein